jgi:hypothetical protein
MVGGHAGQRLGQALHVVEPIGQLGLLHGPARQPHDVLEGGVGEQAFAVGTDDDDHGREQIEAGELGRQL